jgi:beta-phosphoglucomutase-like phosphatase (HAD superfamily)
MKKHQGKLVALFDLDGTLVNTDSANSAAYRVALAQNGMGNILGLYGRITSSTVRNLGCGMDRIDSIVNAKVSAYCHELWRTRLGPAADALQCVIVNRDVFEKIVCLTDSAEQRAAETLRYWSLAGCFDEIVCNGGQGNKYANYFNAFDSDPAACVVWENEDGQIKSAIAAGVQMENIRKVG